MVTFLDAVESASTRPPAAFLPPASHGGRKARGLGGGTRCRACRAHDSRDLSRPAQESRLPWLCPQEGRDALRISPALRRKGAPGRTPVGGDYGSLCSHTLWGRCAG